MMRKHNKTLPASGRPIPSAPPFTSADRFLHEAGARSLQTERTYRAGLRAFADWLQQSGRDGYDLGMEWPLPSNFLTTAAVIEFRSWLLAHKSQTTARTYTAAILGYLHYLDGLDQGPAGVQLGKLIQQLKRRSRERNLAATVVDRDEARQQVPRLVAYYDRLPLPPQNDRYNRRLSLLRNRALVNVLFSTAARLSEILALNRSQVNDGRAETATITGKGQRSRALHLMPYAQRAIQAYLHERTDANPALFVAHSRNALGARLSQSGAHDVVKRAVRAQELDPELSAHDFRHYRATQLLREGMPLEVVQEYLGHVDVSTTRSIYAPALGVQVVRGWLDNLDIDPVKPYLSE